MRKLSSTIEDIQVVPSDSPGLELLVILCGCRRACADEQEIRSLAERCLVIAGESLDGSPRSEEQLACLISAEISRRAL